MAMTFCNDCNEPDMCRERMLCISDMVRSKVDVDEIVEPEEIIEEEFVTIINNQFGSFNLSSDGSWDSSVGSRNISET